MIFQERPHGPSHSDVMTLHGFLVSFPKTHKLFIKIILHFIFPRLKVIFLFECVFGQMPEMRSADNRIFHVFLKEPSLKTGSAACLMVEIQGSWTWLS